MRCDIRKRPRSRHACCPSLKKKPGAAQVVAQDIQQKLLCAYCNCSNSEQEFISFFLEKLAEVKDKYEKNKKKHWSFWLLILQIWATNIVAAVTFFIATITVGGIFKLYSENVFQLFPKYTLQILIGGCAFAVFLTVIVCFVEYRKQKDYRESWVRHSTLYFRLLLAAEKFLCSPQQHIDRARFQEVVFALLESDLLSFERNMQWSKFGDKVFAENFVPPSKQEIGGGSNAK